MLLGQKRRTRFRFTEKTHSRKGIAALVLAVILLLIYMIFIYLAFKGAGNLSMYFGSAGVFVMVISLVSLVLSIQSMREENSFQIFPRLALGFSIMAMVCWIGTYIAGFMLL